MTDSDHAALSDQEHAALSAQLARAIGWKRVDVTEILDYEQVHVGWSCVVYLPNGMPKKFDYRDPSVAMGVLEWLGRDHQRRPWFSRTDSLWRIGGDLLGYSTLPEAIARAAIAVAEGRRKQREQNEAREVLQP